MSSRRLGWSQVNWVRWAELRLAQEVTVLRADDRRLPVAEHGMAAVLWTKHAPAVTARQASYSAPCLRVVLDRCQPGTAIFSAAGLGREPLHRAQEP